MPEGESVAEGEWVLAIFEIGAGKRATASAARGTDKGDGEIWLGFERRDWERLITFSEAKSEKMKVVPTAPPYPPDQETLESIPVAYEQEAEIERTQMGAAAPPAPSPLSRPAASSPIPRSSPPRAFSASKIPTASGKMPASMSARVLLVDDDPDIREVVGAMLEAVGLVIEPATTAEDALERAREKHFDLMVLDWNLPGMTGLDLCRKIRAEEALATIPVLFLTAHNSSKDIVDAFASGADDYVSKPFRAPELGARIFGLLRRSRNPHGAE